MNINFLGLGVQKAGTSTLHDILKKHTEIYLPESKEAHFFDLTENYMRGLKWLEETTFTACNGEKVVGEFTPEYIYMEKAPQRILETLGRNVKFIVIFRHPVDRAVSHYNMIYRRGLELSDFFEAIKNEKNKINKGEWDRMDYSYMDRGLYAQQLKRYLALFPEENFLYLVFENDIVKNLPQTIDRVQSFLGVKHEMLDTNIISNKAYEPYSVKLNRLVRHKLIKRIGRKLFPFSFRKYLKNMILKLNKKSKSKLLFTLTEEEKEKLFRDYFYSDVKLLEYLTKLSFNDLWYTDSNKHVF